MSATMYRDDLCIDIPAVKSETASELRLCTKRKRTGAKPNIHIAWCPSPCNIQSGHAPAAQVYVDSKVKVRVMSVGVWMSLCRGRYVVGRARTLINKQKQEVVEHIKQTLSEISGSNSSRRLWTILFNIRRRHLILSSWNVKECTSTCRGI
ncbi:hypothetical protein J6590_033871 [Homalodisca vitripennis]|nr:hypothetical protein J6590_033871 [Homalodisca vitripennis]